MQTNLNEHITNNEVCPACRGIGWRSYFENGYEVYRECECGMRKREIMDSRLNFANIPESFKDIRLKSFDKTVYKDTKSQKTIEIATKSVLCWLDDFESFKNRGIGLYLYSKTKGSGKTRMAVSIANELMYEKSCQVKFCTSLQILNEIKSSWDRQSEYTESKLLGFLSSTEVLIIDDFGTEQSDKPWISERFYQIINTRYVDKKITIFTSNKPLDALEYDDRITNRIKERTFQLPFPEESIRDVIAKKNMNELISRIKNK